MNAIAPIRGRKGGGCFPAGTIVSVPGGTRAIETLNAGDEIICFDDRGELHTGKVIALHSHGDDDVWVYRFWNEHELKATANHWVLNQFNAFAAIGTLGKDDCVVNSDGHLLPFIEAQYLGREPVFNLTVEPHRTFIADEIRVHNAGLSEGRHRNFLRGNKGGGGKGGGGAQRAAVEAPNTLRSKALARIVDLIGEGEIVGLVDPTTLNPLPQGQWEKAIYFDDTVCMNSDGTSNFQGVVVDQRYGLNSQTYLSGFPEVESEVNVGVKVTYNTPVTRTVPDGNIDAIRVTVRIPSLFSQDVTTGDVNPTSVNLKIELRPDGGSFSQVINDVIDGKCTSPYDRSYRIPLTGDGPWDVKVTRLTADATSSAIQNELFFSSYTTILDYKLTYPNSALVALAIDSQAFGGNVPRRSYLVKGLKIKIPSNYDPVTRVYTGIWDGTFQVAWCNNPAWVMYDILTSERYGLGDFIDVGQVDKWALYSIAQYCDELVPNGFGGTEPRFVFNGIINSREEAYKVVQAIASAFRGMTYWSTGSVTAVQDRPQDVMKLVAPADVVKGMFNYQGSGLRTRFTAAMVSWNDPEDSYNAAVEVVEDPEAIRAWGWRPTEVVAFGCTSRGQAHRFGKWIIDSNKNETQTLTYRAGLDHADLVPGNLISVADPSYAGVRMGGRIAVGGSTSVTIDSPVTIATGETYTLSIEMPDGSIEDRVLTNDPGVTSILTWSSALPTDAEANSMWVLTGTDVAPRQFRVIGISEVEKHQFEITAILYDPTKFDRVEQNIFLEPPTYTTLPTGPLGVPSNITFIEYLYAIGPIVKSALTLSWQASNDARVLFYEIAAQSPVDSVYKAMGSTSNLSFDIQDTVDGIWNFRIRAADGAGNFSQWTYLTASFVQSLGAPPEDVTGFSIQVLGANSNLSWNQVADLDLSHYWIKFSPATSGATWGSSVTLVDGIDATSISVPTMVGTYLIKAVDTSGSESQNATLVISTVSGVDGLNVVEVVTEDPTWAGAKVDTIALGGDLQLDSGNTMSEWTSLADVPNLTYGIDGVAPIGYYYFDNTVDLGNVFTSRLTATIVAEGTDINNVMSSWTTLSSVLTMSGADPGDWEATLQVRYTSDDPAGSPVWSAWQNFIVGDYTARAFEFRVILESFAASVTPLVHELSVSIDMPDRVEAGDNIVVPAAGLTVTFSPSFKSLKGLGTAPQNMQTGDYIYMPDSLKGPDGFFIQFFNSSGVGVERTFDYVAKGYGYVS